MLCLRNLALKHQENQSMSQAGTLLQAACKPSQKCMNWTACPHPAKSDALHSHIWFYSCSPFSTSQQVVSASTTSVFCARWGSGAKNFIRVMNRTCLVWKRVFQMVHCLLKAAELHWCPSSRPFLEYGVKQKHCFDSYIILMRIIDFRELITRHQVSSIFFFISVSFFLLFILFAFFFLFLLLPFSFLVFTLRFNSSY